jgi:hypothetical protein
MSDGRTPWTCYRCGWVNPPIGNVMCVRCGNDNIFRKAGFHLPPKEDDDKSGKDDKKPQQPSWPVGFGGGMPGPWWAGDRHYKAPWE